MNTEPEGSPIVDVQIATNDENIPANDDFHRWIEAALPKELQANEITIRIVGADESRDLNSRYRQKDKPTNVLSFPAELPDAIDLPLLGDLVICAGVVEQEANEQQKKINAHWAHMVVHGTLHLIGYDHIEDNEAKEMECLETKIMNGLGFPDPYKQI